MLKNIIIKTLGATIALTVFNTAGSAAPLLYDQNITPDTIYGSGNSNGSFTVDRSNGVELGLRAKIPFLGTLHSNHDGTYSYSHAETMQIHNGNPLDAWNFDWTVNTDYNGQSSPGKVISDFTYMMGIDFDPGLGTDFFTFDPITPNVAPLSAPFYDHSIGTNGTANGAGTEATDALSYKALIDGNNVLQNSWRHAFFPFHPTLTYDPTIDGTYDIFLTAFDANGGQVASTRIQAIIGAGGTKVPEPAPLTLLGFGLLGMALLRRKLR